MAADETPRAALRRMLAEPDVLVLPGVYDALSASLVRRSGFRGAYMTGAGVSMALIGYPDLGFTTMTEWRARRRGSPPCSTSRWSPTPTPASATR